MFEQSVLTYPPTNKSWSLAVSLSLELLGVSIAILIPLAWTDQLPFLQLHEPFLLAPMPLAPKPQPKATSQPASIKSALPHPVFQPQPLRHLVNLDDLPPESNIAPPDAGVAAGPGGLSVLQQTPVIPVTPPPAPKVLEPPKA